MLKTKTTMTALIALFVTLGWTTPALAADAGMLKMRFTQSGNTSSSWPLYVAEQVPDLNRFGKHADHRRRRGWHSPYACSAV